MAVTLLPCTDILDWVLIVYLDARWALRLRLVCTKFDELVTADETVARMRGFINDFGAKVVIPKMLAHRGCLNLRDFRCGGRLLCTTLSPEILTWWLFIPESSEGHHPLWWGCFYRHLVVNAAKTPDVRIVCGLLLHARSIIRGWDAEEVYRKRVVTLTTDNSTANAIAIHCNYTVLSPGFLQLFGDNLALVCAVACSDALAGAGMESVGLWDTLVTLAPDFLTWVLGNDRDDSLQERVTFLTVVYRFRVDTPGSVKMLCSPGVLALWQQIEQYALLTWDALEEMYRTFDCTQGARLVPDYCAPQGHTTGFFYSRLSGLWASAAAYRRLTELPHLQWAHRKGLVDLGAGPAIEDSDDWCYR